MMFIKNVLALSNLAWVQKVFFINVTSWKQLKGLKLMKDTPKIPTLPCAPCSLKG